MSRENPLHAGLHRQISLVLCAVNTPRVVNLCSHARHAVTHPAKLAGGLRTAIGPASLAGQLAVRSTRAQHLDLVKGQCFYCGTEGNAMRVHLHTRPWSEGLTAHIT